MKQNVSYKMESQKNYPMTLRVPFSVLEFIDEMIEKKLQDGENKSTANRTAVALEMLKIGARVLKKKSEHKHAFGVSIAAKALYF